MSGYKSLDDLEVVLRSGAGVAIICEGEDYREDEFFYKEWFGQIGRSVTFHAQDGWERVQDAVTELRRRGTPVPVYGLLDRDFTPDAEIARQSDPAFDGFCYRLPRYDLESYLLDPEGWLAVLQKLLFRREPQIPAGWDTIQSVADQIHGIYRAALPIAAHNWTTHRLHEIHAMQSGFSNKRYLTSLQALEKLDVETAVVNWASSFGASEVARETYRERLAFLRATADSLDEMQKHVSGKLVFHELHRRIPCAPNRQQPDRMYLADRYLEYRPKPPPEVDTLIQRILSRASLER